MDERRWVPVGKVTRTHGVGGAVKIFPYGDTLADLMPGDVVYVDPAGETSPQCLLVASLHRQKRLWIVRFEQFTTIEQAATIIGREIALPEDRLPATCEGEYYYYQLIGLQVETKKGRLLGILTGILETGGHDVYAITDHRGKEILIPAIDEVICTIDLEQRLMIVDPLEGLIDDL